MTLYDPFLVHASRISVLPSGVAVATVGFGGGVGSVTTPLVEYPLMQVEFVACRRK